MSENVVTFGKGKEAEVEPGGVSGKRLLSFIERIERLEAEKKEIGGDIKEIYLEAKGVGFDPKTIRSLVAMRRKDPDKRREEQEMVNIYAAAIQMELFF